MRLQDVRIKSLSAGLMGTGLLGLLLSVGGTAKAQDARDDARPPQQEEPKQDEAKPPRQDDAKPPKEQAPAKAEDAKPAKNEKQNDEMKNNEMKQNDQMKAGKEENRPQNNDNKGGDHATRAGAQQGQRIPDDKFRSHFGRQHTFHVQKTVIVEGQPRFQYGGYWFALANPWPGDWAYTDDCYIDYIDGEYVLIDLLHPGVQIPVIVVIA
ncbi:MAG: hypothetical protein WCC99_00345 [Candidatus Sulfotelmatobacter sp.]